MYGQPFKATTGEHSSIGTLKTKSPRPTQIDTCCKTTRHKHSHVDRRNAGYTHPRRLGSGSIKRGCPVRRNLAFCSKRDTYKVPHSLENCLRETVSLIQQKMRPGTVVPSRLSPAHSGRRMKATVPPSTCKLQSTSRRLKRCRFRTVLSIRALETTAWSRDVRCTIFHSLAVLPPGQNTPELH